MGQSGEPSTDVRPRVRGADGDGNEPGDSPAALHPQFVPLRVATRGERTALFIVGPLLWVAAVVVGSFLVRHGDAIEIALAVLAGSALLALVILLPMRARRVRNQSER